MSGWRRALFSRSGRRETGGDRDGFAAVDALVALMILTTTIILARGAATTARRAATAAAETRRADQVMQALLVSAPHGDGALSGLLGGFEWRVTTQAEGGDARRLKVQVCRRSVSLRAVASGRRYGLVTAELCPVAA